MRYTRSTRLREKGAMQRARSLLPIKKKRKEDLTCWTDLKNLWEVSASAFMGGISIGEFKNTVQRLRVARTGN